MATYEELEKEIRLLKHNNRHLTEKVKRLEALIADFERASGLHIEGYDGGRLGERVNFVRNVKLDAVCQAIMRCADELNDSLS